jgi:hypothetical protein
MTVEAIKQKFIGLAGQLSPENLTCDGELSQAQVERRRDSIARQWHVLESKFGRVVSLDEANGWWTEQWMAGRRA